MYKIEQIHQGIGVDKFVIYSENNLEHSIREMFALFS